MSTEESAATPVCHCCAEPLDAVNTATCDLCGHAYHLVLRYDVPGKDCGQVWVGDETLGLEFSCNVCLGQPATPAESTARRRYARHEGLRAKAVARRRARP